MKIWISNLKEEGVWKRTGNCYKGAADLSSSMATTGWSSVGFMGLCSWPANLLWLISFNYP